MKHSVILTACMLLLLAACKKDDDSLPNINVAQERYILPGDTLYPEGIAYDLATGYFYTGSVTTGDIVRVDVQTGAANIWASGTTGSRKAATGLKFDGQNRLWVCGGADAKVSVLNSNGELLKRWDMAALFGAGFINDCIIDNTHAYFTDSRVQKIYRAAVSEPALGTMEEWLTFDSTRIPYAATGTNANGIVETPDGRYLIIVVSSAGKLYRISKSDKSIVEIALNIPVTAGDGLLMEGTTLYVSRNALNQIYPVSMNGDYTQGNVGGGFGSNLLFNTTMARAGNYLLVVNGQLNRRATNNPVLPFTVSRVSVP